MRTFLVFFVLLAGALAEDPLRLENTIPLPGVQGRIDHFSVDVKGRRLFVAALGNNTIEVLDLAAGKRLRSIPGFQEPQGVLYIPEIDRLYVANGGDGSLRILDGKTFQTIKSADFSDDADNVRYDAEAKQVWVGYGKGALGALDTGSNARAGYVKLDAHPESFQLEKSGTRIFVNVPNAGHVAVIDRRKRTLEAKWRVTTAAAHYPMALDENHRLFLGCRKPPKVVVFDTASGKMVAEQAIAGDTDDLFYDAKRKRIYVSGGEGFLSVIEQRDPDRYEPLAKIPTAAGARTSLWVADLDRLYLAVPHRPNQRCEIRVYQPQ